MYLPAMCVSSLWLVAALLPVVRTATTDEVETLQRWIQQPEHIQLLKEAWGGNDHPLHAVIKASNQSHLLRDTDFARCFYDALHAWTSTKWGPLKMKDSTPKFPEGLLQFSFTHLGVWDECVSVNDVTHSTGKFNGQMCLVNFYPKNIKKYKEDVQDTLVHNRGIAPLNDIDASLLQMLVYKMGICLPSTCSADHVKTMFQTLINITGIPVMVDVKKSECTVQDREPLDASDWTAVSILIVFGVVIVSSTAYDLVIPKNARRPIFTAFSVVSNGRKLLAAPRADGDQTLSCLHGIRFISMCWVILCHRLETTQLMANANPEFSLKFLNQWYRVGISNATLSVDTFFFLSGLLVAYVFFKQSPLKRKLNLPLYYIHRYIRLTPALAMMTLLSATLLDRVSNGPLWSLHSGNMKKYCRKNWWNNLLYVNNYVDPMHACISQGWYLMVDMQIYWVAPLVIIPMIRAPNWAKVIVPLLALLGLVTSFMMSLLFELPANHLGATADQYEDYTKHMYVPVYTRFVPYLIGFGLGYMFGDRVARGKKARPMKFIYSALSWTSVAGLMLIPLFVGYEFVHPPLPSNVSSAFYNSLARPVWAAGIGGVVYLCANGNGGAANVFLSWTGFHILGRFTYCMYLVHSALQLISVGASQTYNHASDREILSDFASDLVVSLLFAALLSVTCESPFLVLEKELIGGPRARVVKNVDSAPDAVVVSDEIIGEKGENESVQETKKI